MHIADTREQAIRDVAFGLGDWVDYFQRVAALPLAPDTTDHDSLVDALNASGFAVIGTPDDAIAQLERLGTQSKGFGTFLLMAHEWADRVETLRSYELFSRYVMPAFQDSATSLTASRDWAAENRPTFIGEAGAAVMSAIQSHAEEKRRLSDQRRPHLARSARDDADLQPARSDRDDRSLVPRGDRMWAHRRRRLVDDACRRPGAPACRPTPRRR